MQKLNLLVISLFFLTPVSVTLGAEANATLPIIGAKLKPGDIWLQKTDVDSTIQNDFFSIEVKKGLNVKQSFLNGTTIFELLISPESDLTTTNNQIGIHLRSKPPSGSQDQLMIKWTGIPGNKVTINTWNGNPWLVKESDGQTNDGKPLKQWMMLSNLIGGKSFIVLASVPANQTETFRNNLFAVMKSFKVR